MPKKVPKRLQGLQSHEIFPPPPAPTVIVLLPLLASPYHYTSEREYKMQQVSTSGQVGFSHNGQFRHQR